MTLAGKWQSLLIYSRNVTGHHWPNANGLILAAAIFLFLFLWISPAYADPPPGIQEYLVLGYEHHLYRMYKHGGVPNSDLPAFGTGQGYMASVVDVTVTADNQIIFYDHWEDGYEADIFNPTKIGPITGTLVLGDGNPANGSAADFIPGRTTDILKAGDSLPFSSRTASEGNSAIAGFIPIDPRQAGDFRFDGGDRLVSTGGPIGLVHAMWPVSKNSGGAFTNHTWMGDSWEIYSNQVLADALVYVTPIGEDLPGNQFANVSLQLQALADNTLVTVNNQAGQAVTFNLSRGQTYFSGDGAGYIDNTPNPTLNLDVRAGATLVADKPIQAGIVAYHRNSNGFQDRYYNMIPQSLWDKQYIMPTGDNPVNTNANADGNAQVYIYNPNAFAITVTSADTAGANSPFTVAPKSVVSYQNATGAANLQDTIPTLSGLSLKSDAHFWAIHVADADPNDGIAYDWGNTFLPLFFLTDEYYASWAPGNVLLPPKQNACNNDGNLSGGELCRNGSPLWVTAVEDDTRVNVDYDNDGAVDDSFILNALQEVVLRDNSDFDQSGTHIWSEDGQKIAVIWGEDALVAGASNPNLDVGHLVLPVKQEWLDPAYSFEQSASPEILPPVGGSVTFHLKATASSFAAIQNVVFTDTLPANWVYQNGSTLVTLPDGVTVSFEPTLSTIVDSSGASHSVLFWNLGTNLAPEQSVNAQFQAAIANPKDSIGPRHTDGFESNTYDGGSGPWLSNWTESGEATNPGAGNIRIVATDAGVKPYSGAYQLRIQDDAQAIIRQINLSPFAQPMLRFKRYFRSLENNETFGVDVSLDGSNYTSVISWTNSVLQNSWAQNEVDLSPYNANTVYLRFRGISGVEANDYFYLDDVELYDGFIVNNNRATAKAVYEGYDYVAQAHKNIYINPFSLVKEANVQTVSLGSTVVFTLTYANNSNSLSGSNFTLKDTLPPGLNFVSASAGGNYNALSNNVVWNIGDIPPGAQGSVTLTTALDSTARPENGSSIVNAANLSNGEYFVRSNNVGLTVVAPDLQVVKNGPSNAYLGDTITYTIQYENLGAMTATNTLITDTVPPFTTYIQGSCSSGCITSANGLTLTWLLGDIAPGASGVVSFSVKISDTAPLGYNIQNIALVKHNALAAPQPAVANTKISEIKIEKEASPLLAGPGQVLTFTLKTQSLTNTLVSIFDTIPAQTRYITGSAAGQSGVITPTYSTDGLVYQFTEPVPAASVTHLRWDVALISGTTQAVGFKVEVNDNLANDVTIKNQARLSVPIIGDIFSNQVSIPTVKLSLEKLGPNFAQAGDTFTYTLRFGNSGSGQTTVILSDTLPANVNFITASPPPSTTLPLTWAVTLPANTNNIEYTVVASVSNNTSAGTELVNQASLRSDQHTVNTSKLTTVSGGLVSQKFALDLNGPPLFISDTIRYSIVVTNTSSVMTHTNVTIFDSLPISVTFVSGSETITPTGAIAYLPVPHAISATTPSLAAQQAVAATFDVTLNPDTLGQSVTNTAVISSLEQNNPPPPEPVCPNGSAPINGICPVVPTSTMTLTITEPVSGAITTALTTPVRGLTAPASVVTVTLDTGPAVYVTTADASGYFTVTHVALATGSNTITAVGLSPSGASAGDSVVIISASDCILDSYEPDDNSAQSPVVDLAQYNTVVITHSHAFHLPTDQDWLNLTVRPGGRYEFATADLGPLADTRLILYAADGATILAENDDADTNVQYSRINWTAPLTPLNQTVYLATAQTAFNAHSCSTGYTLSLTQTMGGDLNNSDKQVEPASTDLLLADPLTYTITLINSDPLAAAAPVLVTDTLPATVTMVSLNICGGAGQYEQYQLLTTTSSLTWQGALGPAAQVNLCIKGVVAATPWTSINTAWISWNDQVISRSTGSNTPAPPGGNSDIYLPIILKNE